jgi:hypothetical protein
MRNMVRRSIFNRYKGRSNQTLQAPSFESVPTKSTVTISPSRTRSTLSVDGNATSQCTRSTVQCKNLCLDLSAYILISAAD